MISHSRKFIFIHIPRTGGSSLTWSLRKYSDIKIIRSGSPTGYNQNAKPNIPYSKHYSMKKVVEGGYTDNLIISPMVSPDEYDDYYKFTIIRNPWDRLISAIEFNGGTIDDRKLNTMYSRLEYPKGELSYNYIMRFENLQEDYENVCRDLGLPIRKLSELNVNDKKEYKHYSEYYNDEQVEMVRKDYKIDIETFGYEFERI